jgi:protein arginine N-methyltransferase 1
MDGQNLHALNERILRDYQAMMSDPVRMERYREAIRAVCAGKVVCEIGVGLGPLSLMALEAGARRVYGIEVNSDVLAIAEAVIRENGYDDSAFIPISGMSMDIELPEQVDVILTETLDSVGFGENTAVFMLDAVERFLKPGGCAIPQSLQCHVALATPGAFTSQIDFWSNDLMKQYGFDYSYVCTELNRFSQTLEIANHELHSDWTRWMQIDFMATASYKTRLGVMLPANRAGLVRGLAVSFEATLAPGISIHTAPTAPNTHWQQGFCPFEKPIECEEGDTVCADVEISHSPWLNAELCTRVILVPRRPKRSVDV